MGLISVARAGKIPHADIKVRRKIDLTRIVVADRHEDFTQYLLAEWLRDNWKTKSSMRMGGEYAYQNKQGVIVISQDNGQMSSLIYTINLSVYAIFNELTQLLTCLIVLRLVLLY